VKFFVRVRTLAQDLCVRANANLVAGRPDAAWRDLRVLAKLMDYLQECDLSLVAAMMRTALGGLYVATVNQGQAAGLWREEQLAAIQQQNQTMDLFGGYVQAMRGGERTHILHFLDRCREVGAAQGYRELRGEDASPWRDSLGVFLLLAPRGWICQNQIAIARAMQTCLAPLDAKHQRIGIQKPSPADQAAAPESISRYSPYSCLAAYVTPNLSKALGTTAKYQTMLNMAAVGCALQRHRLALGQCPESLEALAPRFMAKLPHELTTGQPFKYRRFDDGRFLLYSVGMNGKDDTAASKASGAGKGVVVAEDDWGWTSTPTR
jgi:hypothetical protein